MKTVDRTRDLTERNLTYTSFVYVGTTSKSSTFKVLRCSSLNRNTPWPCCSVAVSKRNRDMASVFGATLPRVLSFIYKLRRRRVGVWWANAFPVFTDSGRGLFVYPERRRIGDAWYRLWIWEVRYVDRCLNRLLPVPCIAAVSYVYVVERWSCFIGYMVHL